MGNPELWKGSMIVLTHDTSGGWFDHVPPPTPPPDALSEFVGDQPIGLGPRVPAMVLSPWSRGGRVHDTVVDHTSILQFLELPVRRRGAAHQSLAPGADEQPARRARPDQLRLLRPRAACAHCAGSGGVRLRRLAGSPSPQTPPTTPT
ncbi:alkaline phosphatase family protein [Aquihabitans daechungensis]|uniref:alkaline phosphatase family protein n=1 Tax=Aquihabitans daechungensis TaxID=1052257 RepID=UPI003BA2849B